MADLGFLNLTLENLTIDFNLTSFFENNSMSLNVSDVNVSLEEFKFGINGLNDFIYVVNEFLNRIVPLIASKTK